MTKNDIHVLLYHYQVLYFQFKIYYIDIFFENYTNTFVTKIEFSLIFIPELN